MRTQKIYTLIGELSPSNEGIEELTELTEKAIDCISEKAEYVDSSKMGEDLVLEEDGKGLAE